LTSSGKGFACDRGESAREHRRRAREVPRALTTAGVNAAAGDFDAAVNRLYYAAFHATIGVCLTEGLEPKTHRGARHLLNVHFVLTGKVDEWVKGALARLEDDRYLADYQADVHIDRDRYERRRQDTDRLLEHLTGYLRDNRWI
jgi:uncharacterized protein (UPF0332 family)